MNIDELETAARRAWPALEEEETGLGVLRFAAGVSRRAKSFTPSASGLHSPARVQNLSASWFRSRGLASAIRIVETGRPEEMALDCALAAAGYQREAPTAVQVKALSAPQVRAVGCGRAVATAHWLPAWHQLRALAPEDLPIQQRMLARISDPHCPLLACDATGLPVASALGVLTGHLLGVYGVATAVHARRQGFAASLIAQLCAWAVKQGARSAYLQVESGNLPALSLYRRLGFQPGYRYWFRVQRIPESIPRAVSATVQSGSLIAAMNGNSIITRQSGEAQP